MASSSSARSLHKRRQCLQAPRGKCAAVSPSYNTTNAAVVIPPDNGDVTGLQSFTTRDVEYVAEGGNLRVYDTRIDGCGHPPTTLSKPEPSLITGKIIDVKAIDFF